MVVCEFCNKNLSSKYSLQAHQRKTKSCLKIQGKEIKTDFPCSFCEKSFIRKTILNKHILTCKENTPKVIKLKKKLELVTEKLKIVEQGKKELEEKYSELVKILAKKSTKTVNNTVHNINLAVFKDEDSIKQIVNEKYDINYLKNGQKGVADFTIAHIIKNDNGDTTYVITDKARFNGKYKLPSGHVVTDPDMSQLTEKVHPSISKKVKKIAAEEENMILNEELCNSFHEILDMDKDNCIFKNEMVKKLL